MNCVIINIIHAGDALDGRIVDNVLSGPFALNGNTLAFTITFEDFSRGLYMATIITAPGPAMAVVMGGLRAARRKR